MAARRLDSVVRASGLSATLIVRNEAAHLQRCLASIQPITDELIVVDTGSTDDSRQVAAAFGARVFEFPWRDDFSAARNYALDQATYDWILYIDADECAAGTDRAELRAALSDPALVAATVRFRYKTGFSRYEEYRLFRNDPRIRFRNVIHETVMGDVHALERTEGRRIGRTALTLDHFGYDGDLTAKHRRNVPLLRARLAADPRHVYSWNHLGEALAGLGNDEDARHAWWTAIAIVRDRGTAHALDALPYGSLLVRQSARDGELLNEARARFPDDLLFRWLHGIQLAEREQYREAVTLLEPLGAIAPDTFCTDNGVAYDTAIFGTPTWDALALCHFRLGQYEQSRQYYERLSATDPENMEYIAKHRLAEARARAQVRTRAEAVRVGA